MTRVIAECCRWKAWVVAQDEQESGLRAILNYGHTFAHAFEMLTGYRRYRHGEAVAVGMMAAGGLACDLGMMDEAGVRRQKALLNAFGLPTTVTGLDPQEIIKAFAFDKKARRGKPVFVLPQRIGKVRLVTDVDSKTLRQSLKRFLSL
jgi:3-dehydroquinate synthase